MKKSIIVAIAAVVAVAVVAAAAGAGVTLFGGDSDNKNKTATNTSSKSDKDNRSTKKACELLTLADAKTLIGDNAELATGSGDETLASTASVNVDNCTYSADGATLGDLNQITIQRHVGDKSQVIQAYENYKKEYPGDDIAGLGDKAYYSTTSKQLHFLKDNYWVTIFGGSINAGDAGNKELANRTAAVVIPKL